jgi:hypothetical protein
MLPAIVVETLPRLTRAIQQLAAHPDDDAAYTLADELTGITAMVAEKFTNDRTAEGIQKALQLTVGCVSLGLDHALPDDDDLAALNLLIDEGAEHAFQIGFRMIKELVGHAGRRAGRRVRYRSRVCGAAPARQVRRYLPDRSEPELERQRALCGAVQAAQGSAGRGALANWLRRHNTEGPVSDADLNAEGVIALAIIFAVEGGGMMARTGQKEFERFVKAVRKNKPDYEAGWAELLAKVPVQHHPVLLERIDSYRQTCTVLQNIKGRTAMKTLFAELENYAGSELDADYS